MPFRSSPRAAAAGAFCLSIIIAANIGCQPAVNENTNVTEVLAAQVEASEVVYDDNGRATLAGTLTGSGEVNLFALGPVDYGDKFVISFSGGFDAAAAVFNAEMNLLYLNDDGYKYGAPLMPYIQFTIREYSPEAYLAVCISPGTNSSGSYTAQLQKQSGAESPEAKPAIVEFVWHGASGVSIGGSPPKNIPAFNAGDINSAYNGRTEEMIEAVMAAVRHDYEGLNIAFYRDDESIPSGPRTRVFFGTYSSTLLGLADSVDYYNKVESQHGIVYTDSFALFNVLGPTLNEMAQAIANVASHEVGHLLGLNHTKDVKGVMDITANAWQMLQDENFRRSPIHPNVFNSGYQNGLLLLKLTLGGTVDPNTAYEQPDLGSAMPMSDLDMQRAYLSELLGVTKGDFCSHPEHAEVTE